MLLPALQEARASAWRAACMSNERQLGVCMQSYMADNETLWATDIPYRGQLGHEGEYFLTPYDSGCGGMYQTMDAWRDGYKPYMGVNYIKLAEDPGDAKNGHARPSDKYPKGYQWRYTYTAMMREYPYASFGTWSGWRRSPDPARGILATCSQVGLWTSPWPDAFGWTGAAHVGRRWSPRTSGAAAYGWQANFRIWYWQGDYRGQNSLRLDGHVEWMNAADVPYARNECVNHGWRGMADMILLPE